MNKKERYRQVLSRLCKQKILEQYQTVLNIMVSDRQLRLLTVEEEDKWKRSLNILDKSNCSNHFCSKFPFDNIEDLYCFVHEKSQYCNDKYLLWLDTVVPSYYIIESLNDISFSFDCSFSTGIMTLRSITNKERILIEWDLDCGKPMFEVNIYSN